MKPDSNKISHRLREVREQYEYTQSQIAELLNVTQQTYSSYENGRTMPNSDVLLELSKLYGVSVDELIGNPYSITNYSDIFVNSITFEKLMTRVNCFNPPERRALLSYVEFLFFNRKLKEPKGSEKKKRTRKIKN